MGGGSVLPVLIWVAWYNVGREVGRKEAMEDGRLGNAAAK